MHGSAVPLGADDALLLVGAEADPDGLTAALGEAACAEGVQVSALEADSASHPYIAQFALTVRLQLLAAQMAAAGLHDPDSVIAGAWAGDELWSIGSGGVDPPAAP